MYLYKSINFQLLTENKSILNTNVVVVCVHNNIWNQDCSVDDTRVHLGVKKTEKKTMSANCSVKNYLQNINTEKQKGHYSCDCCRIWSNVKCIVLKRWDHFKKHYPVSTNRFNYFQMDHMYSYIYLVSLEAMTFETWSVSEDIVHRHKK